MQNNGILSTETASWIVVIIVNLEGKPDIISSLLPFYGRPIVAMDEV
jgi:hypothetical protein